MIIFQYYASRAPYSPVIEIDDDSHSKFIPDSSRYFQNHYHYHVKYDEQYHWQSCFKYFGADKISSPDNIDAFQKGFIDTFKFAPHIYKAEKGKMVKLILMLITGRNLTKRTGRTVRRNEKTSGDFKFTKYYLSH